jgi:hypothetical protein
MFGLRPIVRLISLSWWKWARAELTAKNPFHPDLPYIVRRIADLERNA